jgi:dTDP-4-amino-4,6-dideoxygalactose transaminase
MSRIYLSPPDVNGVDRELLLAAVDSGWVAPVGPDLDAFEREVAALCGRAAGVGLASGTAALFLGLRELGVGAGDEVLVSTFTFAAAANAVHHLGATPVLVDSDDATWNVNPDLVAEELAERRRRGRPLAAAVVVDLYGQCADYERLLPLFADAGVPVVEDAAEALGATYGGSPAGAFGEAAIMSFNGNKIVTASGGGMLLTNDDAFASRIRYLATQAREPAPHYEHVEAGFNERLSNLMAAFGRGQITDLDRRIERRRAICARYQDALTGIEGIAFQPEASYGSCTRWLTCMTIDPATGVTPERVRVALERVDIEARPTWKPMHLQPVYKDAPSRVDGTSERLFTTGLCLPSGSGMTDDDQERVISALLDALPARS